MDAKQWIRHAVATGATPLDGDADDTFGYLVRNEETGVAVREAVEQDAPVLGAIGSRAFHHAHAAVLHPVDLAGLASRFDEAYILDELRDEDARWLVALWAGETVGFTHLRTATVPASVPGRLPIELRGIYVAPDWGGHGVGSTLIEAASKLAVSLGYESLWVRVLAANRGAVSFLHGCGFARVHRDVLLGQKSSAPVLTLSRPLTLSED